MAQGSSCSILWWSWIPQPYPVLGLTQGLPPALQKAAKVVFVFGSSWKYNRSNLYLAAFSASDVEAGTSKWFYFSGKNGTANTWSNDEKAAAPLLVGSPNVGNHSVVWNAAMHSFVAMYGNILAATLRLPGDRGARLWWFGDQTVIGKRL